MAEKSILSEKLWHDYCRDERLSRTLFARTDKFARKTEKIGTKEESPSHSTKRARRRERESTRPFIEEFVNKSLFLVVEL
ncbi:hypothetical protein, partial [Streptococcus suis]|uniref:hypothetical protein n=1 Tax=Streptococcus suis TaxID=1307 RepID=UPI001E64DDEC